LLLRKVYLQQRKGHTKSRILGAQLRSTVIRITVPGNELGKKFVKELGKFLVDHRLPSENITFSTLRDLARRVEELNRE
jgi:hypothetical protein